MAIITLVPGAPHAQSAGLIAGYAFDEGTGTTTADASGNGITGALTNGAGWGVGHSGESAFLDGSNDFVDLGNPAPLQLTGSMTVSAWINSASFPADDAAIVSKRYVTEQGGGFQLDTTIDRGPRTIGFKLTNASGGRMFRYGATTMQLNTWYYVTGVYDAAAGTLHVYLNGQLDDGTLDGTVTASQLNSSSNVSIGKRQGGFNFSGRIDDVRVYNRALTQSEVQTDMNTPVPSGPPPTGFANEVVLQNLNFVPTMVFLPGGKMLVGEIGGTIRVVQPGAIQPDPTPFNVISGAVAQGDAGLQSIALDPNFATNGYYYVHYAHSQGSSFRDRVSRFTAASGWNTTVANSEVVLWQDDANSTTDIHHGATVGFGPDGKLYISMGDNGFPSDAQSLTNYHGKILRINPDGTIPADNPFVDGNGGNKDEIWAYGFRNPYRFSFDSVTGNMYVGDVGGNDPSTAWEELNLVQRGANYGWPLCEGNCTPTNITDPIYTYAHAGRDACIIGGFVYRGSAYPSSYQGNYFLGDYAQNRLKRLTLNAAGTAVTGVFNFEPTDGAADNPQVGDPVWMQQGPDGSLYYLDLSFDESNNLFNSGTLRRMRYLGSGNQAPTVVAHGSPLQGQAPLTVSFSSAGTTDPEGDPLTYNWNFGDGSTSTAPNPSHTYSASGRYPVTLTVSDGTNSPFASLTVSVGTPPVGQILTPTDGSLFVAGDHISISGDGTDAEDGTLPNSAFSWTVIFHHDGHVHPGVGPINGVRNFTFDIPTSGHDFSGFTRYEIVLTVTDSDGLTHTSSVFIFPDKVNLSFDTSPSGLTLQIDGIAKVTPFVLQELKGFQHTISAPAQTFGGTSYAFASWSDGGAQSHGIVTPTADQSYVATFGALSGPTPVAAYGFTEGSGTSAADASGTGNTGAIGSATWTTSGKYGNALSFNGTNARVTIPDAPSLRLTNGMTLEAWVYPTRVTNAWRDVVYKGDDNYFLMATSKPQSRPAGGGIFSGTYSDIFGTSNLALNTWTHLATTYDGATLRLYVNGVQVASKAQTGTLTTSSNPLQIGGDAFYGQYFAGRIDEVRVYASALSASQVQSDMNAPIGGSPGDTQPPTAPSNLQASAISSTQVNLSWTGSTDNVAVTGYRVERCQGAGCSTFAEIAQPSGTTFNDTGRSPSTSYSYRVRAVDAVPNFSGYSNTASATTLAGSDTQPPTAPSNLQASAISSTQVNLSWTGSTDNVAVTGYRVERCQGAGCSTFAEIAQPSGTTFNDTGRSPSTSYSYRVRAVDAVPNFSGYSNTASATTPAAASGLVAAYSFSEGTGTTVADASGTGNGGSIGTATWTTSGKYGNALSFNGTNARVTIPDAPSLRLTNGMTLEAWVFPTVVSSAWRDVVYKGDDNYFLMSTSMPSGRPAGGGIFSGTFGDTFGTLQPPAQYVDAPRDDLRRGDTQAVRQRRAGREQGADRHADNVLEPAPDRW